MEQGPGPAVRDSGGQAEGGGGKGRTLPLDPGWTNDLLVNVRLLKWLHRRGVSRRRLRGTWVHRVLGDRLFSPDLWSFTREGVARGWLVGSIVATTPFLGAHLLIGLPLAMLTRSNLLVVFALILATNPVTAAIFYPFAFLVGCEAMGRPVGEYHFGYHALWQAAGPLFLGCLIIGLLSGLGGWLLIRWLWKEDAEPSAQS